MFSKRKLFTILTIFTLTFGNLVVKTDALDAVLQAPDVLNVTAPGANSKVKGTINIVWTMFDNDQNVIPYTANLYDAQTCNVTNYGQINSNPNGISSLSQNNNLSWNTRNTLSNSNLSDGNYCLKICAALKNGPTPYSACNGRNITIINNNRLPVISSIPSKLTIFENESWSYQITAFDPDGDPLQYRFISKPAFLDINSQTGLITSNSASKIPNNANSAIYTVVLAVDDNFSGAVTQQFDLTVKKVAQATPPTPPGQTPPPTPPSQQPEVNHPTTIKFTSPTSESIFQGEVNLVQWEVEDENGIEKIVLQYSSNTVVWTDLTEITEPDIFQYNWNVSEIENGEYLMRLVVTDSIGSESSKTSNEFLIRNEEDETPVESIPLIINTSPINNSEIEERLPQITGEFVPSTDATIDPTTFEITLDDVDISEQCAVDETGFSCITTEELPLGSHRVEVAIKDSNEKAASVEWTFTIVSGEDAPTSFPEEDSVIILGSAIPRNTVVLIILICCLALLLLIIPWLLYVLWSRRRERESITTTTTTQTTDLPALDTTYNYYVPPFDASQYSTPTAETSTQPAPNVTTNYYYPENYTYDTGTENTFETKPIQTPEFTYPDTTQTTTTTQTVSPVETQNQKSSSTQVQSTTDQNVVSSPKSVNTQPGTNTTIQTTTTTSTTPPTPTQPGQSNVGSGQNGYVEPTAVD